VNEIQQKEKTIKKLHAVGWSGLLFILNLKKILFVDGWVNI
jgi:hypothetical protein